jgi:hypothetical protein
MESKANENDDGEGGKQKEEIDEDEERGKLLVCWIFRPSIRYENF